MSLSLWALETVSSIARQNRSGPAKEQIHERESQWTSERAAGWGGASVLLALREDSVEEVSLGENQVARARGAICMAK